MLVPTINSGEILMTVLFKACIYTGIIVSLIVFSLSAHSADDDDFLTTLTDGAYNCGAEEK